MCVLLVSEVEWLVGVRHGAVNVNPRRQDTVVDASK